MKKFEEFGRLLRKYRGDNHLTQEVLLTRLNQQGHQFRDKSTLSKWESGTRRPKQDVVEGLEDILHIERGLLLMAARLPVDREYIATENRKIHHQSELMKIAHDMLANNLENVNLRDFNKEGFNIKIYDIPNINSVTGTGLSSILGDNFAKLKYNTYLINCFCEHMKIGYTTVVKGKFQDAIYQNPYELIKTLCLIKAQRVIKGECEVCKQL